MDKLRRVIDFVLDVISFPMWLLVIFVGFSGAVYLANKFWYEPSIRVGFVLFVCLGVGIIGILAALETVNHFFPKEEGEKND